MKPLKALFLIFLFYTRATGQTIIPLTTGQVYNYEVGDTFIHAQTMDDQYPITYTQTVITSKTISANNDTVTYGIETKSEMVFWGPPPSCCQGVTEAAGTLTYINLSDTILQILSTQNPHGYTDTAVTKTDSSFSYNGILYNQADFYYYPSNCHSYYTYGVGLGCTYSYWICPIDAYDNHLVYYHKKNGSMAGEPHYFYTSINDPTSITPVTISPNPATDTYVVNIAELPLLPTRLHLFDALGREVKTETLSSLKNTFSRNGLEAGIYIWQVESRGNILNQGKIAFN